MQQEKMDNLKASFEKDGYVFIKGFLGREQVDEINSKLVDYIRSVVPVMPANHVFYEDKERPETLKQLQDLQVHSPFFNQLMTDSAFEEVAEILLGEKVIGKNVEYFNKPPLIGKATPPHQDAFYFNLKPPQAVTMWLALEDVAIENGCVSYVTGSHKKGMRAHGRTQTLGFSQGITDYGNEEDAANVKAFPAEPGDLLVHHCMTIHSAGSNTTKDRTRKALGLIYFGESAEPDLEAREAYKKSLNIQGVNI